jgi:hypothetical protein
MKERNSPRAGFFMSAFCAAPQLAALQQCAAGKLRSTGKKAEIT